jgi:hypothetical protein
MRRNSYKGASPEVQKAMEAVFELRSVVRKRTNAALKQKKSMAIVGQQELDGYILQCNPKIVRKRRDAVWYEHAMQRLVHTVLVLREENKSLRKELGRAERDNGGGLDQDASDFTPGAWSEGPAEGADPER